MPAEENYFNSSLPSMNTPEINFTTCPVEKFQEFTLNHDSSHLCQTQIMCGTNNDSDTVNRTFDETSYCSSQKNLVIYFDSLVFNGQFVKKTPLELNICAVDELKLLANDLSKAVKEISNQLVKLLVENDALQQESDARNIAIEQLLKMTVKITENELKPVQMSVILPPEECENDV